MKKAIEALKELYMLYGEPADTERLALILKNLKHFDETFILEVFADIKHTRTSPYLPKFPDFVAHAKKLLLAEEPSPEDAWGHVVKNVSRGEPGYESLPATIQQAVDDACGWNALRNTSNLLYFRNAFISTYKAILDREVECQLKP